MEKTANYVWIGYKIHFFRSEYQMRQLFETLLIAQEIFLIAFI